LVLESQSAKVARRVFNVGSTDQNFQKQQLIDLIRPHAPDAIVEFVHKAEDPRDYRVSFTRIREQLGFHITRTVREGIAEVSSLIRENVINDFENGCYRN
jgi:nucleoside-diphosphate-sugar epimerase